MLNKKPFARSSQPCRWKNNVLSLLNPDSTLIETSVTLALKDFNPMKTQFWKPWLRRGDALCDAFGTSKEWFRGWSLDCTQMCMSPSLWGQGCQDRRNYGAEQQSSFLLWGENHNKSSHGKEMDTGPSQYSRTDSYHNLNRPDKVTIFRLRTGHNRLRSHLFNKSRIRQTCVHVTLYPWQLPIFFKTTLSMQI